MHTHTGFDGTTIKLKWVIVKFVVSFDAVVLHGFVHMSNYKLLYHITTGNSKRA